MATIASLWAYIGPETALPLASALAAVVGVLLMFWNFIWRLLKKSFQLLFGKKGAALGTGAPRASVPVAAEGETTAAQSNVAAQQG